MRRRDFIIARLISSAFFDGLLSKIMANQKDFSKQHVDPNPF